ncbi:hypothetical protein SAICODRAFT_179783 [Saitoella complicata NRRL Y-17804]|uniref:Uncharacterized protein n=1 Tax=Saitoella complicata (strain BCRC 22490 / CBS 7301 / JCM 7358 / NBRC 10748 / NRRL Y-17804) TaxID=698492 RepID=A0A0E9NRW1_SAICN|nr:uncharacterized protein SAICODRAFT_179783 [Saitoella complicata NRRL Y-17804]ODQ49978.1 hypothetical protein SAICODRAFT_179783 [Saitoella complicata NRRL Y-17804]GAO52617.1 hypothetical protein G7K_6690-t1 [Saitoella complicata NRRL Y-17804]
MASYGYFTPHHTHPTYHRRDTSSSLERLQAAEVGRARRESAVSDRDLQEREWVIFSGRPGLGGHRDSIQSLGSGVTGSLMLSSVSGVESQAVTLSSGTGGGIGSGSGSGSGSESGSGEAVEVSAARRGPALQFPSVHEELTLSTASDARTVTTTSTEDEAASLLADVMVTPTSDEETKRKAHGTDAVVDVDEVDEGTASVRRVEAWMRTVDSAPLSPSVEIPAPPTSTHPPAPAPATSTLNAEEGIVRRVMRELLHLDDEVLEVFFGERVCSLSPTSSAHRTRAPPPSPAGFDARSLAPDDSASAMEVVGSIGSDSLDGVVAELGMAGGRAASMGFAGLEGEDYSRPRRGGAGAVEEMDLATSIWRAVQSYLHSLSHPTSPHANANANANANNHAHPPTTADRVRLHFHRPDLYTMNSNLTSNWERRLSDLGRRAQSHYSPKPMRSWTCRSQSRSLITRTTGVGVLGVGWMGSWAEI